MRNQERSEEYRERDERKRERGEERKRGGGERLVRKRESDKRRERE